MKLPFSPFFKAIKSLLIKASWDGKGLLPSGNIILYPAIFICLFYLIHNYNNQQSESTIVHKLILPPKKS